MSDVPDTGFAESEIELLLDLLRTPTAGPLETAQGDPAPRIGDAQRAYADAASTLGFEIVHHRAAEMTEPADGRIPRTVRDAMSASPDYLALQPNLVLRRGSGGDPARTLMFNVHIDTVGGVQTVSRHGGIVTGRGAVDAKGPAVALLSGLRRALADPDENHPETILIQVVAGEEGGAMGIHGTKELVELGFTGRVNVFCEPTGSRIQPRSTSSMTAKITVDGDDSIDDMPAHGHNATVLLGFLAQRLASEFDHPNFQARACIAGLHTGTLHNRVYGTGQLLVNLAYRSASAGGHAEAALEEYVRGALKEFSSVFSGSPSLAKTARDCSDITSVVWLKRGLPALNSTDEWAQRCIFPAEEFRWAEDSDEGFTCDAIWMHGVPDSYTVVFGPGDLDLNNAHADGEFVELEDLDRYADQIHDVVRRFAHETSRSPGNRTRS